MPIAGAQYAGGWLKLFSSWTFANPTWVSYQGDRTADASVAVYDTNAQWADRGQPMLPLALGALTAQNFVVG